MCLETGPSKVMGLSLTWLKYSSTQVVASGNQYIVIMEISSEVTPSQNPLLLLHFIHQSIDCQTTAMFSFT